MTPIELMADNTARTGAMLKNTIADFTDAELLVRPCSSANHAAWQLGNIITGGAFFFKAVGADLPELPEGFNAKYGKGTNSIDDPKHFETKATYIALFDKMNDAIVQFTRTRTPEDLNRPTPEKIQFMAPTLGHVLLLQPTHITMHLGQIQAIRRKLGKPVLF